MRVIALALLVTVAPAQKGTVVVAMGDSTTAPRNGVRAVWTDRLRALCVGPTANVIGPVAHNRAVAGETTVGALRRFAEACAGADVLVLQYGINDAAVDVWRGASEPRVGRQAYAANLHSMLWSSRFASRRILLTPNPLRWTGALRERYGRAPYDVDDPRGFDLLLATYAATAREVAQRTDSILVDVHRVFSRRDRFAGHATADLLLDGMHPNDEGHRIIAHLVTKALYDAADTDATEKTPRPTRQRPDYSIPVLDLSGDRHRQVVVDREPGQYLGHPTTVLLEDGRTMIAVYPKGHGRGAIVMKRSTDGGRTWSERLPTPPSWATSREVPTIHRVVDAAGTRRLILFSGLHPIRMARSGDDGATWSELEPIGDFGGIVAMGCVIPTKTAGRYLALFHDDGRFFRAGGERARSPVFHVYQTESVDGGLTWGAPRPICSGMPHHCEPGFVRSPDGGTIAVLMRENSRRFNSHVIFSRDEGATWSPPRELPGALCGDRHVARYAPDGRLFVTFRDRTLVSPTHGDWVGWVGTFDDIANGREGQYRVRLMDNTKGADCAYPGLELLPDGTFVTTTYGHWTRGESPYVVSVRLRLEELDALATDPRERR